jgi:hypothetical protein
MIIQHNRYNAMINKLLILLISVCHYTVIPHFYAQNSLANVAIEIINIDIRTVKHIENSAKVEVASL